MNNEDARNRNGDLRLTPNSGRAADAWELLPDRCRFGLDAARWETFLLALEAPPKPAERLARLLLEPNVFEGRDAS